MGLNSCKFLLLLVVAAAPLHAQQDALPADPPQDAVTAAASAKNPVRTARLAFFSGDLLVQRADNTGADDAVLNMPLLAGTRLISGDYAQAEVEFEDGSVARLTPRTSLSIDALTLESGSTAHTQLTLLSGLAYFELRTSPVSNWRVDAGGVSASPEANSVLRVSVEPPAATFSCLTGSTSIESPNGFTAKVKTGESLRPDPDDASRYFLNQEIAENSWDTWNQSRDELAAAEAGSRTSARDNFAGTQGYGWSDLDANGTWYAAPADSTSDGNADADGDEMWQPAAADVDADFDPYADGAFVWSGQGYVYASSYAWGWLPYRCGRWNYYPGFGWAWSPNRFCGVWGFGGVGGGVHIGRRPPHYELVRLPLRGPGPIHPIHRIGRDTPPQTESTRPSKVAKIDGAVANPLQPVAGSSVATGFAVGQALYRDYPIDSASRKPILGTLAKQVVADPDNPISGWISRQGSPEPPLLGTAQARIVHTPTGTAELRPAAPTAPPAQHSAPPASHSEPPPVASTATAKPK